MVGTSTAILVNTQVMATGSGAVGVIADGVEGQSLAERYPCREDRLSAASEARS